MVLNSSNSALFSSIITVGAMLGSILGGVMCDKLGRKTTITVAAVPFALAWAWIALTSSFGQLVTARFVVGFMVGIISMAVPLYIGETAPTHLRGGLGALNQFGVTIGILASYVVGILVEEDQQTGIRCNPVAFTDDNLNALVFNGKSATGETCDDVVAGWTCELYRPSGGGDDPSAWPAYCEGSLPKWRVLAWVAAAASAALFVCMSFMPETPVFLFKCGRPDLAREVPLAGGGASAAYEGPHALPLVSRGPRQPPPWAFFLTPSPSPSPSPPPLRAFHALPRRSCGSAAAPTSTRTTRCGSSSA